MSTSMPNRILAMTAAAAGAAVLFGCSAGKGKGAIVVCSNSSDCANGKICAPLGDTAKCVDPIPQGLHCTSYLECDEDALVCEHSIGLGYDEALCLEIGKKLFHCVLVDDCAEGLFCDYERRPPSCGPRKTAGQSCSGALSKECLHGLVCVDPIYREDPATCSTPGKQGDRCVENEDCAADHYCSGWAGPGRICKQKKAAEADCDFDKECQGGLFCDDCVDDYGVCTALLAEGSECACDKACAYPFVCASSLDTPVCKPRSGPGGTCGRDVECAAELVCGTLSKPGKCQERGGDGQPCARREECAPGLACRYPSQGGDSGTCKPGVGVGDVCGGSNVCAQGMGCNKGFSPPICEPPGAAGQKCGSKEDCSAGLTCMGQLCRMPGKKGDPCLYTDDCGEDLYCDPSSDQYVCMPVVKEGGPCVEDEQCGQGFSCSIYAKPPVCVPSGDPGWNWEDEADDE